MMRALALALALAASTATAALAQNEDISIPKVKWSFDGPFGTFDRASMQRGYQVYREVCSNCHSMRLLYYRDLHGIGLSEEQVRAVAAEATISGGTDDSGQPVDRPGLPSDHFKSPFANDKAARAANGGALPPDQSLIIKAREDGPNYVHALMNGYEDPPPEGVKVPEGQYYNNNFPGHFLAMPPPLHDGQLEYDDGTQATVDQMSRDVVQFLSWASSPEMETRKQMGVKVVLFLCLLTGLTIAIKKKIWKDVH
jgi:ubiquinol-cytochrome c reductase cytochrome c1 subunit